MPLPLPAPQPGDLAFSRAHSLIGAIITHLTHSPYSHVKVCLAGDECVEATPRGVILSRLCGDETVVSIPYATAGERLDACYRALEMVGHPYSFLSYLSDLFWFCRLPIELQWRGQFNCAQLAAYAVGMGLNQDDVTPGSLYRRFAPALPVLPVPPAPASPA